MENDFIQILDFLRILILTLSYLTTQELRKSNFIQFFVQNVKKANLRCNLVLVHFSRQY